MARITGRLNPLARMEKVVERAQDSDHVRLLWDICQIDFQKTMSNPMQICWPKSIWI